MSIIVCVSIQAANAAPVINNVSGTLEHNGTVTISGSNFGTKTQPAPLLYDSVDNQESYATLQDGETIPTSSEYIWSENKDNNVKFSKSRPTRHKYSTAQYHAEEARSYLAWPYKLGVRENIPERNTLYVSWYFLTDTDPASEGGSNKFIRIWDDYNGNATRISWTQMHETYNSNGGLIYSGNAWGGKIGQWNRMEVLVDASNHIIKSWTNGKLIHNITNFYKVTSNQGLSIYVMGFDHNLNGYQNMSIDFDEIYADSTQARVEIGDAPTWQTTSHREIQLPSQWSDTDLTITIKQGTLNDISKSYLYVVDADGKVNEQGYPLCTTCPKSPAGVSAR